LRLVLTDNPGARPLDQSGLGVRRRAFADQDDRLALQPHEERQAVRIDLG
jgi:hypothetical protein